MEEEKLREEVVHIIGIDIVSFSTKSMESQVACIQTFRDSLNTCISDQSRPLILDTGDGAILVLAGSILDSFTLSKELAEYFSTSNLDVRMGFHTGLVTRMTNTNGTVNAYGPGINTCQRIMNACLPGGLLVSRTSAELIGSNPGLAGTLNDLETIFAKHGEQITVAGVGNFPGLDPSIAKKRRADEHNLPEMAISFIGRTNERSRLRELVLDERRRLVTIAGPGGIGKTTIANVVGKSVSSDFADGVWLVECDALKSSEDIAASLTNTLGLSLSERNISGLREALHDLQCLIILDCLEKFSNLTPFVDDLLSHCPGVQLLATSRVLLTSKWETEFFIGPLALKRGEDGNVDAELLFVEAARQVDPSFRLAKANRALIESVVNSVQGVPLAIILAAGRLKYGTLFELKTQLEGRKIDVLKRRSTSKDRHSDLSLVVAESFELLDSLARETLVELAVFTGGFYLADAMLILDRGIHVRDSIEVLRDNSLVVGTTHGLRMRYRTLDVVAEYVESQARSINLDSLQLRHAQHFADKSKEVRRQFEEGHWSSDSETFWIDLGNFRRAIEYATENDHAELILTFTKYLARIFMEGGLRSDFERLGVRALRIPEISIELKLELQGLLGGIYRREDNRELAEKYWLLRAEQLEIFAEADTQGDAWTDLACMALHYEDCLAARTYLDRFDRVAPSVKSKQVRAVALIAKGILNSRSGLIEEAKANLRSTELLLIDFPRDTRILFTYAFITELYINVQEFDTVVDICKWSIPEAIEGKHPGYAGHLLLALSKALWLRGETNGSVLALLAAEKIPKSISRTLRTKLKEQKEALIVSLGEPALKEAESSYFGKTWHELAKSLLQWYNSTWLG